MAYTSNHSPINWQNYPSTATPINETNLNQMDNEIGVNDSRIVELDANKVDKEQGKGLSTNDYDNTAKGIVDGVTTALAGKVDKVTGKGLSTNDYDNTAKGIVDGVTTALSGKVDKVNGKGLSTNDYTTTEKTKLAGIETGAQVNTVTGVKGDSESTYRTGNINMTKANIGLGNVDNTSDANKPISTATQTALDNKVDKVEGKGLSTEDFTTTEKTKLAGISAQANKVEITPVVTEGTTLATISIDGVDTAIKGSDIDVDSTLSLVSNNPVENKTITSTLNNLMENKIAEGNPITIHNASGLSAKSCEVTFHLIQAGSGDPSPENVRPITVWNEVNVYCDTEQTLTPAKTITADLDGSYFSGKVVWNSDGSCKAIIDTKYNLYVGEEGWSQKGALNDDNRFTIVITNIKQDSASASICNYLKYESGSSGNWGTFRVAGSFFVVKDNGDNFTTLNAFKEYLSEHPLQLCYPLSTPIEINLSASEIELLSGTNCLWTDGDNIRLVYSTNKADDELSSTSENPVQNKVVKSAFDEVSSSISGINTALETKAEQDGNYEDMAVGQLLSNIYEEDKVPYNFRTAGGTLEIGDREYDTLVGGTVAFNQLVQNVLATAEIYGITRTKVGSVSTKLGLRYYGTSSRTTSFTAFVITNPTSHHKYYVTFGADLPSGCRINYANTDRQNFCIINGGSSNMNVGVNINNGTEVDFTIYPQYFDLTQMFGSTIADYIYSLEQATAGSGVAYFKSLFPKDYYDYNAGQLMSVKALSHKMVGFNQWNEQHEGGKISTSTGQNEGNSAQGERSVGYTAVIPNAVCYVHSPYNANIFFIEYNASKEFLRYNGYKKNETYTVSADAHFIRFYATDTTNRLNGVCINLHWDGERDGEYEAYEEHIYPLDSDLELRGIPKLDANNNLYYDGDTYESDGTVTRRFATVDMGKLYWSFNNDTQTFVALVTAMKSDTTAQGRLNVMCSNYKTADSIPNTWANLPDKTVLKYYGMNMICVKDTNYSTDATAFKTAMNGVYLLYDLETPTTETADIFQNPQLVDNWGTEEYTDSREVQIPVGHITKYPPDLKAKLESAPDSPASDGDYILRHNNGVNTYVADTKELPAVPTTNGTYVLKATVSSGTATLSWVAET